MLLHFLVSNSRSKTLHLASFASFIRYLGVHRNFFFGFLSCPSFFVHPNSATVVLLLSDIRITCPSLSRLLLLIFFWIDFTLMSFWTPHLFLILIPFLCGDWCLGLHTYMLPLHFLDLTNVLRSCWTFIQYHFLDIFDYSCLNSFLLTSCSSTGVDFSVVDV